jgi:HK97 family phage major capsid protein
MGEATAVERGIAALVGKLDTLGDDITKSREETEAKIKEVADALGEVQVDLKQTTEQVEQVKAGYDGIRERIRRERGPFYVSGMEDEAASFSMIKAVWGMKSGDWTHAGREKELLDQVRAKAAGQVAGNDIYGGYFIPDQVIPDVIQNIYTLSRFISLDSTGTTIVSVLNGLVGGKVTIPKFAGGMLAWWIGERESFPETKAKVANVTLDPKKLGLLVRTTEEMIMLQGFGFDQLFRRDMEKAAAKELDRAVAYGSGTDSMPRGITKMQGIKIYSAESGKVGVLGTTPLGDTTTFQASWAGAELTFDGMDDMLVELEEDDISLDENTPWVLARRLRSRLARLKIENYAGQTAGQPYLVGAPMLKDEQMRQIIGDFVTSNQIGTTKLPGASINAPTSGAAKFTDVFGGNLSEVVVGRWGGISIDSDMGKGTGFQQDEHLIKLRLFADTGIRQERAVILCPDAQARN